MGKFARYQLIPLSKYWSKKCNCFTTAGSIFGCCTKYWYKEVVPDLAAPIIKKFGKSKDDTGATEVQVAILSHRISELTEHLKVHKKDKHTRRGLVQLVSQRKKLLKYLRKTKSESYISLIKELSIRG